MLDAERKAGELLGEMPKNPGGRSTADTLSEVGIAHHQSSRWQRIASIPEAEYALQSIRGDPTPTGATSHARGVADPKGVTMAHHKRRRSKNRRAGCLLCAPRKLNGASPTDAYKVSELRRLGGRNRRVRRHDVPGDE